MSDVFISYARIDGDFVRRINEVLLREQFDVWVDLEHIPPTAKWIDEILSAIESADAFLFVLSPESIASEICSIELERAAVLNKRLVPVLYRSVPPISVPEGLRVRHWIDFSATDRFESAIEALVIALRTDLESARKHTRLLVRALEWERNRKSAALLLRGDELRAAEQWIVNRRPEMLPVPTPLHLEYVSASRIAEGRRQRLTMATAAATALVLGILAIVALWQRTEAIRGTEEAQRQRTVASEQRNVARARQLAAQAVSELPRDPELCVLLALEAAKLAPRGAETVAALRRCVPEARTRVSIAGVATSEFSRGSFSPAGDRVVLPAINGEVEIRRAATGEQATRLRGQPHSFNYAAFSPDGHFVGTHGTQNAVVVYDTRNGREVAVLRGHTKEVDDVIFSPDGVRLASTAWDNTTRIWNISEQRAVATFPSYAVARPSFGRNGQYIIVGNGPSADLWNPQSGEHVARLQGHEGNVTCTSFSPDGRFAVTASVDETARIWEVPSGRIRAVLRGHTEFVRNCAVSADSKLIATGSDDGTARVWDASSGQIVTALVGHRGAVRTVAFSPDSTSVLTASSDSTARVWVIRTGEADAELRGHTGAVVDATYSPDGALAVTRSVDHTVRIWDTSKRGSVESITLRGNNSAYPAAVSPNGAVIAVSGADRVGRIVDLNAGGSTARLSTDIWRPTFSADGRLMASTSSDSQSWRNPSHVVARVWAAPSGREVAVLRAPSSEGQVAAISPDGRWVVVCAAASKVARLWNVASGEVVAVLQGAQSDNADAPFSPDSSLVVFPAGESVARVWDVPGGGARAEFRISTGRIYRAWFSRDGRQVLTTSSDGVIRSWDVQSGKVLREFQGHSSVLHAAFDQTGTRLLTTSADTTARLWNVQTGTAVIDLVGHTSEVVRGAFSPDGRWIATASNDHTARIWDASTGALVAQVTGHKGRVSGVAFRSDAKHVVSVSADAARVFMCDACVDDLVALARSRVSRGLTREEQAQYLGSAVQ